MRAAIGDFHYSQTKYLVQGASQRENFLGDVDTYRHAFAAAHAAATDGRGRARRSARSRRSSARSWSVDNRMWAAVQGRAPTDAAAAEVDPSNDAADSARRGGRRLHRPGQGRADRGRPRLRVEPFHERDAHGRRRPDRAPRCRRHRLGAHRAASPAGWRRSASGSRACATTASRESRNGLGAMAAEGDLTVDVVPSDGARHRRRLRRDRRARPHVQRDARQGHGQHRGVQRHAGPHVRDGARGR